MKQMLRLGVGSFALTFGVALFGSIWNALPRAGTAHAEAAVLPAVDTAQPQALAEIQLPTVLASVHDAPAPVVPAALPSADAPWDTPVDAGRWSPPVWFPESTRADLWALEGIDGALPQGPGPDVDAASVFVYDVDAGRVLYALRPDDRRPVASLTKVVSSLTTLSESPDLNREICIDSSQWPGWPGAHSYLNTGTCMTGWDLLGAALVASDNRAAFAFSSIAGLPFGPFVGHMNEVAADLGMSMSSFDDPAGVDDDNLSTARDMTRAILAASLHPVLSTVASAPFWDIAETRTDHHRRLFSTNKLVDTSGLEFLAAKTGYTDTAHYCFEAVARTSSGRRVALVVLGAPNVRTRWADVRKILAWADEPAQG